MEFETTFIKINWKLRMLLGIATGVLYASTLLLFTYLFDDTLYSIQSLIFQAIVFGGIMFIGFPFVAEKLTKSIHNTLIPNLIDNEIIEVKSEAVFFIDIDSFEGIIFSTNKRLIFKSNKIINQEEQVNIDFKDIEKFTPIKNVENIDDGIKITTLNDTEFIFIVDKRDKWITFLNKKIQLSNKI